MSDLNTFMHTQNKNKHDFKSFKLICINLLVDHEMHRWQSYMKNLQVYLLAY